MKIGIFTKALIKVAKFAGYQLVPYDITLTSMLHEKGIVLGVVDEIPLNGTSVYIKGIYNDDIMTGFEGVTLKASEADMIEFLCKEYNLSPVQTFETPSHPEKRGRGRPKKVV